MEIWPADAKTETDPLSVSPRHVPWPMEQTREPNFAISESLSAAAPSSEDAIRRERIDPAGMVLGGLPGRVSRESATKASDGGFARDENPN